MRLVRARRGLRELALGRASAALLEGVLLELETALPPAGGYALYTGGRP